MVDLKNKPSESDHYFTPLSETRLSESIRTEFVGRELHLFDELDSTNSTAFQMAASGAVEGTAVIADMQRGGRGRRGRSWHSPAGCNIYTSVVLRPKIPLLKAPQLTLVAAVALSETASHFLKDPESGRVSIKWPNDILIDGRKCAGILTEMKNEGGQVAFVVVGMGINVNMTPDQIPDELASPATSLLIESGEPHLREEVLQFLYSNMENWYKRYLAAGMPVIRERWNSLARIEGKRVRAAAVIGGVSGYEDGIARGIDNEGALLLENEDGRLIRITAGDLALL